MPVPPHHSNLPPQEPFSLEGYLEDRRCRIDACLERCLAQQQTGIPQRLFDAMHYSLMAGGKRLRPVLCLAACELVGDNDSRAEFAACALEMIHTYSLIHDDLPAMDDDSMRRGKATCHIQFDEATAVLAGDALLTMAFRVLSSGAEPALRDSPGVISVIATIADAAGPGGMIGGQMLDILAERQQLSLASLRHVHALKTGEMIAASIKAGAMLGGASPEQLNLLEQYAHNAGLAFQVMDDILNVEGDAALLGKNTGTDAARGKNTYPALMGLEESREFAMQLVANAVGALAPFHEAAIPLQSLADYIVNRNR